MLENDVEVGAFVEVSRSHIDSGTIARHLAYLGNASVGRDVNVGAGTITANFDGSRKNESQIGDRVRIGAGAGWSRQSLSTMTKSSVPGR